MKIYYDHNVQKDEKIPEVVMDLNRHLVTKLSDFESFLNILKEKRMLNLKTEDIGESAQDNNRVLLTFDDGYKSFKDNILPLLEKYEVPAVLFITTGFVEGRFTPHAIDLLKMISAQEVIIEVNGEERRCGSQAQKKEVYSRICKKLKILSHPNRMEYMSQLKNNNPLDDDRSGLFEFLSWSEVQELDRHPLVTIGSHTRDHSNLKTVSWRESYKEIKNSKWILEEKLGHAIELFSYPYGANSFFSRQITKWAGYKYAFATGEKEFNGEDRSSIPRIEVNNADL